jgi:hypothetical protein
MSVRETTTSSHPGIRFEITQILQVADRRGDFKPKTWAY